MALNKDMLDLIGTVHKPVVFYLPGRLFHNIKPEVIKQFEAIGFFNSLFFIDDKGNPFPIEDNVKYISLLGKSKILKSNIFQLLEMKANLNEDTFLYVLKDYKKEVDTWISATEVIKNEAQNDTKNYVTTIQTYLDLQYQCLKDHREELKSQFGKWKNEVELERISRLFKKVTISNSESNKLDKRSIKRNESVTNRNQNDIKHKLKKDKVYLSSEDADKYLLKTVFNVRLKEENSD